MAKRTGSKKRSGSKRRGGKRKGSKSLGARAKACGRQWRKKSEAWRKRHSWTAFLKGGKGKCSVAKKK